ncbi:MAG: hypothetical protein SF051_13600 [Elusimicrobiota bacterium]|nr:hypothetical protein [Elusimicrobiota bacterium]
MTGPAAEARAAVTVIYLAWLAIHLLVLAASLRRRRALMPPLALPIDLAWDLFRASSGLTPFPGLAPFDAAWPFFALTNAWLVSRHAREEFLLGAPRRWFWPALLASTAAWLGAMAFFCLGDPRGPARLYAVFGPLVNLAWSLGFLHRMRGPAPAGRLDLALWWLRVFGSSAPSLWIGVRLGLPFPLAAALIVLLVDAAWLRAYLTRRRADAAAAS